MEANEKNRIKWLHLRLTPSEYRQLHNKFKKTTCRKLSEYIRAVIFRHPVVATYRNDSLDELMAEMITLNKELNAIGNNINQIAKRLHTIQAGETNAWAAACQGQASAVMAKIGEVKNLLETVTGRWLR